MVTAKPVRCLADRVEKETIMESHMLAQISVEITKKRLDMNMSQAQFAKFLRVSQRSVSKLESGNYDFTIETICKVFEKLGLKIKFTITEESNGN